MSDSPTPQLSVVVIGYNEGKHIRACLESVHASDLTGIAYELIYVDGGSRDNSLDEARAVENVSILGGDKQRRAAENRNLGAKNARGKYIQFLDGDMQVVADWPKRAIAFLNAHSNVAAVSGMLEEANTSFVFRVLQIDWNPVEGEVDACGGAAMYRRDVFIQAGGFPEDVGYGEEPLLCWRIRNQCGEKIWYLDAPMAKHDLGFSGLRDYWKRCVNNGRAYIEIASRCWKSDDPLWKPNVIRNFRWAAIYVVLLLVLIFAPLWMKIGLIGLIGLILMRLTFKTWRRGHTLPIAAGYAIHCYAAKIPLAWGQMKWLVTSRR